MSISTTAQTIDPQTLSALSKALRYALQRQGHATPSHDAMRHILAQSFGFTDPGALFRANKTCRNTEAPAAGPSASTDASLECSDQTAAEDAFTRHAEHGDYRLDFVDLGEGYDGEYEPNNPEDAELYRVDLYERRNGNWEAVEGGSWCTQLPTRTPRWKVELIGMTVLTWLAEIVATGQCSARKASECLASLHPAYRGGNPAWIDETALRAAGLNDVEITHALSHLDNEYTDEAKITLNGGREIRFDGLGGETTYVRVMTPVNGHMVEVAYWTDTEFTEDASLVLGALLGCAGATPVT